MSFQSADTKLASSVIESLEKALVENSDTPEKYSKRDPLRKRGKRGGRFRGRGKNGMNRRLDRGQLRRTQTPKTDADNNIGSRVRGILNRHKNNSRSRSL